jgi:hypothetical protein
VSGIMFWGGRREGFGYGAGCGGFGCNDNQKMTSGYGSQRRVTLGKKSERMLALVCRK